MSEETAVLTPIEEKTISFYGDEITAALVQVGNESQVFVPLRPICDYLGLNWSGQLQRLKRDTVLVEAQGVCVIHTPQGKQEMICLPLDLLPGWLFGVDSRRVKLELQEKVKRYRAECFKVLWRAFQSEAFSLETSIQLESTSPAISALESIRNMGIAITQLAEQQIEMEQRLNTRINKAGVVYKWLEKRVDALEDKVGVKAVVTPEQAAEIQIAVRNLAKLMEEKDGSKKHYGEVYMELYRRFGVNSYLNIRQSQYDAVMKFLDNWRHEEEQKRPTKTSESI